jgi:hypothetical protein
VDSVQKLVEGMIEDYEATLARINA